MKIEWTISESLSNQTCLAISETKLTNYLKEESCMKYTHLAVPFIWAFAEHLDDFISRQDSLRFTDSVPVWVKAKIRRQFNWIPKWTIISFFLFLSAEQSNS